MESDLEKNSNSDLSPNTSMISTENKTSQQNKSKIPLKFIKFILVLFLSIYSYFYLFKEKDINKLPKILKNSKLKEDKIYNIDSSYEKVSPNDNKYIYIPIIGTNDFHGKFFPSINHYYSNGEKIEYKSGGLEYIAKYINIIKKEFGPHRVLYFDSGDQFFYTNETILFDGKNIFDFFDSVGLNGTTLGNMDYVYNRQWIENKIKEVRYPYLINNIKDIYSNKTKGALGDNQEQSHLYEIKLNDKDVIKIGVIGLTMNMGVDKAIYNIGNKQSWNNISFLSYQTNIEQESKKLKKKGANAVLLLSHIGLICHNEKESLKLNMYDKYSKQSKCEHNGNSLLYNFIKRLKPGTIDGIIGGDTHNNVHHWVDDIPIMITKGHAKFVNIMYLAFKKENNEFILDKNNIKIEGPLSSCEKIFINLNHCEKMSDNNLNLKLTDYFWHNEKMNKDEETRSLFDKYYELYNKNLNNKIAKVIGFSEKLKIQKNGDNLFGNLITDIIRNITNTNISIVNLGMFQSFLSPGYLTIFDFIKMIPYQYHLCTTNLTGKEIKQLIKKVQISEKGFLPSSGLKQFIKINQNNNKKQITDIKLYSYNNTIVEIDDEKEYSLSSNNFFMFEFLKDTFASKDSLKILKSKIKNNEIKCSENKAYIEIMDYFKNKGTIDINQAVDTNKKRIVVLK